MLLEHLSPAYVQKQLGHTPISIAVDTYGHCITGEGRQGLEEALLLGGFYQIVTGNHIFSHILKKGFSNLLKP